ncbi:hypothetical protein [Amycolatopsis sp. cmx-4-68]|uniref:hypothetical protein n=1 Tax=Amycolatopsis sp. cmx-4-68 TaxID=2790938 RepID=UPI003978675C
MPNPRDLFRRKIRTVVGVLATGRTTPAPDGQLFARARPESVHITESHYFEQEISRNPSVRRTVDPTGEIEIVVPFDGADHFSRLACADVAPAIEHGGGGSRNARIGHLVFNGHQRTDLGTLLGIDDSYGSLPIEVPVAGRDAPGDVDRLKQDCYAGVIRHEYRPHVASREVFPIGVIVDLLDPDTLGGTITGQPDLAESRELSQQPNFRPYLWLRMQVIIIIIPRRPGQEPPEPVVDRISLDWPTITSLRDLQVEDDNSTGTQRPLTYNPVERTIEWRDVPMRRHEPEHPRDDEFRFVSDAMVLLIRQPGELYRQPSLDGKVEVKIPGYLLSGTQTRLFDSIGRRLEEDRCRETSRLTSRIHLILGEAFARRKLRPHQHLYFDEVIPEQARIADIENALADRGFEVAFSDRSGGSGLLRWSGTALRSEGPEMMKMVLYVEGSNHETERTVQKPGGHSYTSKLPSGELKVFMYGELPRASRAVTREMNALHAAVSDRFDRIRALR